MNVVDRTLPVLCAFCSKKILGGIYTTEEGHKACVVCYVKLTGSTCKLLTLDFCIWLHRNFDEIVGGQL